jgi:hypothetical protein
LRIKSPEGLKEHSPLALGRLLGLDRAPEVKTLRRKLTRLAAHRRAADFGRALAERRVVTRGYALGFLYLDGHVRAYHGKRSLPKTHLARMRLSMRATTDYWVNDAEGEPLFVVTSEANKGLVAMLPVVLDEVRSLVGERRVTVVFDRGGWSPKLFAKLITRGFDILTYRKGRLRRVLEAVKRVTALEKKRASTPTRVPVQQVTEGEVVKLSVERKHITDLLKMVAYQAEGDLLRLIGPHYRRTEDEGRTLIQNALAAPGDIEVTDTELQVSLSPLTSPHRTHALAALCEHLNETNTRFPGSNLLLRFNLKPVPQMSLAFPGPRPPALALGVVADSVEKWPNHDRSRSLALE